MKQPFCAPSEALRRVLDAAAALPRPAAETLPLDDAVGRIAAEPLSARMDQPPFDRSPLDGYALHSADTVGASREAPVTLPVVMKLYAGDAPASPLPAGCAARIMTGAPLPEGADCVLMQELTDGGEDDVRLYAALKPEENVVFRGGDIAAGTVIAGAGTVLTPAHLGVLAGQGYAAVPVCKALTWAFWPPAASFWPRAKLGRPAKFTTPTASRTPPGCGSWASASGGGTARTTRRRSQDR